MSSSGSPNFDVHGYSGCPLKVFHAPNWDTVLAAINTVAGAETTNINSVDTIKSSDFGHSRFFVEKVSESVSYNPRLRKQADKQLFFFQKIVEGAHEQKQQEQQTDTTNVTTAATTRVIIPPILFVPGNGVAVLVEAKNMAAQNESHSSPAATAAQTPHSVIMPFVHHTDSLRFLCTADTERISRFEDRLRLFMKWMADESPLEPFPVQTVVSKLQDLRSKCDSKDSLLQTLALQATATTATAGTIASAAVKLLDELLAFFGSKDVSELKIPIGLCHGDLTLSNILVQESTHDRIVLIDFLDSFIESPLADMAKLNQDLAHGWTLRMLSKRDAFVDPVRLFILFRRMMKRIVLEPFGDRVWFAKLFRPMCIVSQLRVLQYAKDEAVARYLWQTIEEESLLWVR